MRISQNGIELIKYFEGLRLTSYQDIAGIWTIGYGHTGPEVGPNQTISEAEAEELLRKDVNRFENGVDIYVKVDIDQSQFDALVSLAYNIGLNAFRKSTALRLLNKRDFFGAAEAITWWNKATIGGVKREVMGLVRRRAAEAALFLENVQGIVDDVVEPEDSSRVQPEEESTPRRPNPINTRTTGGAVVTGAAGAATIGNAMMNGDDEDANDNGVTPPPAPEAGTETDTPESTDSSPIETPEVIPENAFESDEPEADADGVAENEGAEDNAEPISSEEDDVDVDSTDTPTAPEPVEVDLSDLEEPETPDDSDALLEEIFDAPGNVPEPIIEQPDFEADQPAATESEPVEEPEATPASDASAETISIDPNETPDPTENTTTEIGEPSGYETGDVSKEDYQEGFQIVAGAVVILGAFYVLWARLDDWMNYRR